MDNLVPLAEAARSLGVDASTLRWQIKKGRLAATKLGRDWYLTAAEIKRYRLENRRGGQR